MTIPYDMGPDCHPSGKPFLDLVPRWPPLPAFGTCLTPTKTIPFDKPARSPVGPPPLVSPSWLALLARLVGRRRDDIARREALEAARRSLPFDFGMEASRGR